MDKIEKIKGWVARDDDGTLAIHYEKPRRVCYYNNEIVLDGTPWVWENEAGYGLLPVKIFPDLKWEDEPLEVELAIKRISTLSEEPDKNLDEAAEDFAEGEWDGVVVDTDGNPLYSQDEIEYTFKAGAEWQKEQMLKNAVETEVWSYSSDEDLRAIPLFGIDKFNNLKDGDKVKVIVLKEEE